MADAQKIYVTEDGLKQLKDEYENLVHVVREEVKAELAEARSLGDLSENADYDAARDKQAQVESRITEIEEMLKNVELIDTSKNKSGVIRIGSTVKLQFQDTKEEATYTIVGSTEANPLDERRPSIGNSTPLALALIEHKAGQVVEVNAKIPYSVTIISVD